MSTVMKRGGGLWMTEQDALDEAVWLYWTNRVRRDNEPVITSGGLNRYLKALGATKRDKRRAAWA
jgi:hypothetical protein